MEYSKEQQALGLIEELEEFIESAKAGFINSSKITVDREEIMRRLAEIKEAIPMDMTQAKWLLEERAKMDRQAQEAADTIIKEAEQRAEEMVQTHQITQFAMNRAKNIEDNATEKAREINNENITFISNKVLQVENDLHERAQIMDRSVKLAVEGVNKELEQAIAHMSHTVRMSLDQMMQQMSMFDEQTQQVLAEFYDEREDLEAMIQHLPIRKDV